MVKFQREYSRWENFLVNGNRGSAGGNGEGMKKEEEALRTGRSQTSHECRSPLITEQNMSRSFLMI